MAALVQEQWEDNLAFDASAVIERLAVDSHGVAGSSYSGTMLAQHTMALQTELQRPKPL